MTVNKGLIFKKVPEREPIVGKDLDVEDRGVDLNSVPDGKLIVELQYSSFDPYERGRMRPKEVESYIPAFDLGEPFTNYGIGKVVKSSVSDYKEGDLVYGMLPTIQYAVITPESARSFTAPKLEKLNNKYNLDPKLFLGPLGMPGLTAYSSFYEIGKPKKGETILISAASGAVGQIVGQLAKHEGLNVIGSVGSDEKLDFILKGLKFDSGFNYKKEKPADAIKRLAPKGIDIYFENVGGEHLGAAIDNLHNFGRIICCGMISQYSLPPAEQYKVPNIGLVVRKRLKIQGFIVGDPEFGPKYNEEHRERVSKWISDGDFTTKIDVVKGIDNAATGFLGMLAGKNFGKSVLEIKAP